jgi:hypothetical protein
LKPLVFDFAHRILFSPFSQYGSPSFLLQFFRGHLAGQLSSLSRHLVSTFVVQRLFVRLATPVTAASSSSSTSSGKSYVSSSPKVEPTPVELSELIQEVVDEMKPLLSSLLGLTLFF